MTWMYRQHPGRSGQPLEPGRPSRPLTAPSRWSRRSGPPRSQPCLDALARLQQRLEGCGLLAGWLASSPQPDDCPPRFVLIIDGDDFGRETLSRILEADGYEVLRARNARDGIEQLRGSPRPELVLLDMPPPCLDGWQFVRTQERDPALRDVPVIVLSSIDPEPLCRPFRAVVAHFEKPVTVSGLLDAIRLHLPPT